MDARKSFDVERRADLNLRWRSGDTLSDADFSEMQRLNVVASALAEEAATRPVAAQAPPVAKYVTHATLKRLAESMAKATGDALGRHLSELRSAFEARVAALETAAATPAQAATPPGPANELSAPVKPRIRVPAVMGPPA